MYSRRGRRGRFRGSRAWVLGRQTCREPTTPRPGQPLRTGPSPEMTNRRRRYETRFLLCAISFALGILLGLPQGRSARSLASSYGPGLYGSPLACGGRLTASEHVVAHRLLPCGTRLRICARRRCTWGVVRDRGPYVSGRTFDLSEGTVRALGFSSAGAWGVRAISWRRL